MDRVRLELVTTQIRALATVANGIDIADLEEFVRDRNRAMAIGPILQPTSWLEAGFDDELNWIELAEATIAYRRAVAKVVGEVAA